MKRSVVDIDGPVSLLDYGGDGPPMLMLHGIGGAAINWALLAPLLVPRFHVVAIDLPGFGESPLAGRSAALDRQADLVSKVIEALGEGPVTLAGHSMGGTITMLTAATHARQVSRLVLFDAAFPPRTASPAPGVSSSVLNAASRAPWIFGPLASLMTRARGARAVVIEGLYRPTAPGTTLPDDFVAMHVAAEEQRMRQADAYVGYLQAWRWFHLAFADPPPLDAMVASISAPALLFHGDADTVVSPRAARRLAEIQPSWRLEILPGIGHNPNFEVPARCADVIGDWIEVGGRLSPTVGA